MLCRKVKPVFFVVNGLKPAETHQEGPVKTPRPVPVKAPCELLWCQLRETQKHRADSIRWKLARLSSCISKENSTSLTSFFGRFTPVWEPLRIKKGTNYTVKKKKKGGGVKRKINLVRDAVTLREARWQTV